MASDTAGRVAFIANPGGHIDELIRLSPRIDIDTAGSLWVTSATEQTTSLLAGRETVWVRHVGPRNLGRALTTVGPAAKLLRLSGIRHVITTGAALALPYVAAARMLGIRVTYIESAARQAAPSLTGKLVSRFPGVELYCQADDPIGPRWIPTGSVFDGYMPDEDVPTPVRRVVVSVGGERFSFRRAVDRLKEIIPPDVDVFWQTGATPVEDNEIPYEAWVEPSRLARIVDDADVAVIHAGVGSALTALDSGHAPVLLVRQHRHGEHVDDHQGEIAAELVRRGLAVGCDLPLLTWRDVERAAARRIRRVSEVPPLRLRPTAARP